MIKDLDFIKGGLSRSRTEPSHIRINCGRATTFNGVFAMSTPISLDVDCSIIAKPLMEFIKNSDKSETPVFKLNDNQLVAKSGDLTTHIDCINDEECHGIILPAGERQDFNGELFIKNCKFLKSFAHQKVIEDHEWAHGIIVNYDKMIATNNIAIIEYDCGELITPIPCIIPLQTIKQIIKMKEVPTEIQVHEDSITFHYSDDRWLKTSLFKPELDLDEISDMLEPSSELKQIDDEFFNKLNLIKPYCDNYIYIYSDKLSNGIDLDHSTKIEIKEQELIGSFNLKNLLEFEGLINEYADSYLKDSFVLAGSNIRGIIMRTKINGSFNI